MMKNEGMEVWRQWAAINRALAGSLDFSEVLRAIADRTRTLLSADAAAVLVAGESGDLNLGAASGILPAAFEDLPQPLDERVLEKVRERLGLSDDVVVVAVPIISDEVISGVLVTVRADELDAEEVWMLDALADQAALALRNARLHEMELEAARRQQQESQLALAESERRVADTLRSQERWLESVFDLAPSPILLIEPETRRQLFANRAVKKLVGQGEGAPVIPDAVLERIAAGEALEGLQMEWTTGEKTRTLIVYSDTFPPLYGHPSVSVVVFHDITLMKEVEAALRKASDVKDEFLATLSHELRTPLTVILGWTGMLRLAGDDEELRDPALGAIETSVKAQSRLIDDLLDVSRIVKGTLKIEKVSFDLSAAIREAAAAMRPVALDKQITLRETIEPGLRISGDAQRFQQIVGNLLSNAMKFTPSGGWVNLELRSDGQEAVLIVSDSGQGISAEFLPYVFDRFRQEDISSTRAHGGLGLGLSIVKSIIDLHGGSVAARSDGPGMGATMTVRVPLSVEDSDLRRRGEGRSRELTGDAPLQGARILVVEDDSETLRVFQMALEGAGAEVLPALSVDEALRLLESAQPQVIVSDIALPGTDGYGLMIRLRESGASAIPAIAVTGYAGDDARQKSLEAGFHEHLEKPVGAAELIAAVSRTKLGNT
jgi:signal transduction histidine kinase